MSEKPWSRALVLWTLTLLSSASIAEAQLAPSGPTFLTASMNVRGNASAYDSRNGRFLVVGAHGGVTGRLVNSDGSFASDPFPIDAGTGFPQYPSVAYSPDANGGSGAFLVSWHANTGTNNFVHIRLISASGAPLTGVQVLGTEATWWESAPMVEYASGASKVFMVTWRIGAYQIRAARVSNAGVPLDGSGTPGIVVTATAFERDPSIAYNPDTDQFLIAYSDFGGGAHVYARLVAAGSGVVSAPQLVSSGTATYITDATYSASAHKYVVGWYQLPGGPMASLVGADGVPGSPIPVSSRYGSYDGYGLAYNPVSRTSLMVGPDSLSYENGGVEISDSGTPGPSTGLTFAGGPTGNFYPQVSSSTAQAKWLLTTAHNFTSLVGQFAVGTASCSLTPSVTSISAPSSASTGSISLTGTCPWSAGTSASWVTITSGSSGTGAGAVGYSIAANTGPARSANITIGTLTIPVSQSGCTYAISSLGSSLSSSGTLNGQIGVAAPPGCAWVPVTGANWLATGSGGTGNGIALYSAPRNPYTSTRVGIISVGGWNYTVTQAPAVANDLTDDGRPDLIFQHDISGTASDGQIGLWSMQGEVQSGSAAVDVIETDANWKIVGMADFDRNGSPDIVWRNSVSGANRVWLMDGTHFLSEWAISGVSNTAYKIVGIADFNSDFIPDILWQRDGSGDVAIWFMTRANDGTFVPIDTRNLFSVPGYNVRGVADFNRDGYPDIVWQNKNAAKGDIAVWFMRWGATGPEMVDTRIFLYLNGSPANVFNANYQIVAVGDFNNDLRADLVWQNGATGELAIWLTWDNWVLDTRYLSVPRLTDLGWRIVGPR